MANNYTQFSEVLGELHDDEMAWAVERLELLGKCVEDLTKKEKNLLLKEGWDLDNGDPFACFEWEKQGREIWLYSEESGEPEHVAKFVQSFFRKWRPYGAPGAGVFSMTWASTCSKPRVGEFGGGGLVVTSKEIVYLDTWSWVRDQKEKIK